MSEKKYTKEHEWVEVDGDTATVGITNHAQESLGDIVFIGPRPALYNQQDLISLRRNKGLNELKPGITGWAQVNGRDNIGIHEKVELDYYYYKHKTINCKDVSFLYYPISSVFHINFRFGHII